MARKEKPQLLRGVKDDEKPPRVAASLLGELLALKEDALVSSMQAQEADLRFRSRVAQACRGLGVPIDQSIVCLGCGMIRPTHVEQCPECVG